jgi:hypothetical protein
LILLLQILLGGSPLVFIIIIIIVAAFIGIFGPNFFGLVQKADCKAADSFLCRGSCWRLWRWRPGTP